MSHDPNNAACPCNEWYPSGNYLLAPDCTCPPTDEEKAADDMAVYGTGILLDGKHVPIADVIKDPAVSDDTWESMARDYAKEMWKLTAELATLKDDHRRQSTAHILICARKDAELAAARAENERLQSNRCDHCGADIIDKCILCGAPQCCPQCCKIDYMQRNHAAQLAEKDAELLVSDGLIAGYKAELAAVQIELDKHKHSLTGDIVREFAEKDAEIERLRAALTKIKNACNIGDAKAVILDIDWGALLNEEQSND